MDVAPVAAPEEGRVDLTLLPGPRLDWLADPRALTATPWTVSGSNDRVGMRLTGPALSRGERWADAELPSEGVVVGGVQVPADGQPIVFLADHPVTGGYPVVAVVADAARDALAQARPGPVIRFRHVR